MELHEHLTTINYLTIQSTSQSTTFTLSYVYFTRYIHKILVGNNTCQRRLEMFKYHIPVSVKAEFDEVVNVVQVLSDACK